MIDTNRTAPKFGTIDMDFQPQQHAAPAQAMPIVTFDDWHRALMGPPQECEEIAPEPIALPTAPLLAALMQSDALKPKPRRLRQMVPSPRKIAKRIQSVVADTHAKQTFAGIAVLVMLLIWAI